MRSTRRLTSVLLGAALLMASVAPGVAAQSASPSLAAPQTCGVLTADEVSAALGVTVTVLNGTPTDCEFDADNSAGSYVSLYTSLQSGGGLDLMRTAMCTATASSASPAPCGVDVQIGDAQGLYLPDSMGTLLFVAVDSDNLFDIQLVGSLADGVDKQAAITGLATLAMGRLATMPLPTQEPVPSQRALEGAPDLEAQVPAQIGGVDVSVQSMSGNDLAAGGAVPAELTTALAALGKTIADVRVAFGYYPIGSPATIIAVQVVGADMATLKDVILPTLSQGQAIGSETTVQISGKDVTAASVGEMVTYVYPHGDVLFVVSATDPALTEIFSKLP